LSSLQCPVACASVSMFHHSLLPGRRAGVQGLQLEGGAPPGRLLKRTTSSYTLKLYDWRSSYVVPLSALDCAGSHSNLPPILGLHRGPVSVLREPQHLRFSWRHAQSQFSYLTDRACHRVFGEVGSLMPPTSPGKYQSIIRIAHQVRTQWPWAAQHSVVCIDPEDGSQHRSLWDPPLDRSSLYPSLAATLYPSIA
jgi:hypothetical protein